MSAETLELRTKLDIAEHEVARLREYLHKYDMAIFQTHGKVSLRSGVMWEYTASPVDVVNILRMADMEHGREQAKLLALLDKARNWVQDPELRAEIKRVAPPAPRDKE